MLTNQTVRYFKDNIFGLPSTGYDLTPLMHCSTNRLAFCPVPYTVIVYTFKFQNVNNKLLSQLYKNLNLNGVHLINLPSLLHLYYRLS